MRYAEVHDQRRVRFPHDDVSLHEYASALIITFETRPYTLHVTMYYERAMQVCESRCYALHLARLTSINTGSSSQEAHAGVPKELCLYRACPSRIPIPSCHPFIQVRATGKPRIP